jgi:hypothetical protein
MLRREVVRIAAAGVIAILTVAIVTALIPKRAKTTTDEDDKGSSSSSDQSAPFPPSSSSEKNEQPDSEAPPPNSDYFANRLTVLRHYKVQADASFKNKQYLFAAQLCSDIVQALNVIGEEGNSIETEAQEDEAKIIVLECRARAAACHLKADHPCDAETRGYEWYTAEAMNLLEEFKSENVPIPQTLSDEIADLCAQVFGGKKELKKREIVEEEVAFEARVKKKKHWGRCMEEGGIFYENENYGAALPYFLEALGLLLPDGGIPGIEQIRGMTIFPTSCDEDLVATICLLVCQFSRIAICASEKSPPDLYLSWKYCNNGLRVFEGYEKEYKLSRLIISGIETLRGYVFKQIVEMEDNLAYLSKSGLTPHVHHNIEGDLYLGVQDYNAADKCFMKAYYCLTSFGIFAHSQETGVFFFTLCRKIAVCKLKKKVPGIHVNSRKRVVIEWFSEALEFVDAWKDAVTFDTSLVEETRALKAATVKGICIGLTASSPPLDKSCEVCGVYVNTKACSACKGVLNVYYCCVDSDHQTLHWKEHKIACKGARRLMAPTNQHTT